MLILGKNSDFFQNNQRKVLFFRREPPRDSMRFQFGTTEVTGLPDALKPKKKAEVKKPVEEITDFDTLFAMATQAEQEGTQYVEGARRKDMSADNADEFDALLAEAEKAEREGTQYAESDSNLYNGDPGKTGSFDIAAIQQAEQQAIADARAQMEQASTDKLLQTLKKVRNRPAKLAPQIEAGVQAVIADLDRQDAEKKAAQAAAKEAASARSDRLVGVHESSIIVDTELNKEEDIFDALIKEGLTEDRARSSIAQVKRFESRFPQQDIIATLGTLAKQGLVAPGDTMLRAQLEAQQQQQEQDDEKQQVAQVKRPPRTPRSAQPRSSRSGLRGPGRYIRKFTNLFRRNTGS